MTDATLGAAPAAAPDAAPAAAPAKTSRISRRTVITVAIAVAVAAAGVAWIMAPKGSVSTDDAYLQADSTQIAPKVRGLVSQVLVRDNQVVKAGDPLVRIDAEEFDARAASAAADLQSARAAVQSAQAALDSLGAETRLADAGIDDSRTRIRAADAQTTRAAADRRRFDALASSGAVTGQEVDTARATLASTESDAAHSRAVLEVSRRQATVVRARRPMLEAALAQAHAGVARAQAALDLARQDQTHALIRAPIAGVVGDRQAQPGDYVQPGSRLMTLVPSHALYVVANFKETQTSRMLVGQAVRIKADALPGEVLTGRVESFAPGSGSQFSLLPYEPGTGNFTKIVQRVPVRIELDPGRPRKAQLRPGLSVTAIVDLHTAD